MNKVEFLKDFAESIGCVLVEKGKCGFGRPCVGILEPTIGNYVDINPFDYGKGCIEEDYSGGFIFGYNENLEPDQDLAPNAYHKHSCMAVLVHDEDYDQAITELYDWVVGIQSKGQVELRKHSEVDISTLDPIMQMFAVPYNIALVYEENK